MAHNRPISHASIASACIGLLVVPMMAHAQVFLGGSLGRSNYREAECGNLSQCEPKDTAGTVRLGYQYMPWLAVEGRYFDLGKVRLAAPFGVANGVPLTSHSDFSAKGLGIDAVLSWPATERFMLSAMAGVARIEGKSSYSTDNPVDSPVQFVGFDRTHRSTNSYYGIAAGYALTPQVRVSLEAERYRVDFGGGSTPVDLIAAGLTYRYR